ncbi:MAG TPA: ABC transporter permease subunit [Candidatus Thermoplasmatota archaeon]|nr:ABC transporter permease subunit [Candidatus Thermoplasmatota archaeon]
MERIPLADWVNALVLYLRVNFRTFFRGVSEQVTSFVDGIEAVLLGPFPLVFGVLVALATLAAARRSMRSAVGFGLFTALGLGLIHNLGLWGRTMDTLALVLAAGFVSLAIGLPLGVLMARVGLARALLKPALDFMQTMPAFVYLIPAIVFFNIGTASALFATVVFASPAMIRLVAHGIEHVDKEVVEASEAFGATWWQTLWKVQVPLARPSILVGLNQTLMLSLSMVVIAAMIGAGGLGAVVLEGLATVNAGRGFEGGISIVILAVVVDRITQAFGAARKPGQGGILSTLRRMARAQMGSRHAEDVPLALEKP